MGRLEDGEELLPYLPPLPYLSAQGHYSIYPVCRMNRSVTVCDRAIA